jgi:hypothetical protein
MRIRAIVVAMVSLCACDGGNGSNGQPDLSTGQRTDKQVCDDACSALGQCGVLTDSNCSPGCVSAGAAYVSCVRAANNDCNKIALCALSFECGGVGPSGAANCGDTAYCEGQCNINNPTGACACGCVANMAPSRAIDLVRNNACAPIRCPQYCNTGPTANGALCDQCFGQMCTDKACTN